MKRHLRSNFPAPTRPKLADVAREAGVSPATVSRVINNPALVRAELRDSVRRAIAALGFSPDGAARALALGRSRTIGAVVPTLGTAIFADGVEALQNRLSPAGYTLLLANSQYDRAKETQEIRALLHRGLDGLVLVGNHFSRESLRLIEQFETPTVITYVTQSRGGIPTVGIDNAAGSGVLTSYLLSLGHRRFGVIGNTVAPNDRTEARRDGIARALESVGVTVPPQQIEEVPYSISSGSAALNRLLARSPDLTAVMCTSDALAVGALAEAHRLQIRVPDDLSITGFDDIELAAEIEPTLTTLHVPARAIGQLAAERLLDMLAGNRVPLQTVLEARLAIRGSTGPVRQSSAQLPSSRWGIGRKRSSRNAAQSASAK